MDAAGAVSPPLSVNRALRGAPPLTWTPESARPRPARLQLRHPRRYVVLAHGRRDAQAAHAADRSQRMRTRAYDALRSPAPLPSCTLSRLAACPRRPATLKMRLPAVCAHRVGSPPRTQPTARAAHRIRNLLRTQPTALTARRVRSPSRIQPTARAALRSCILSHVQPVALTALRSCSASRTYSLSRMQLSSPPLIQPAAHSQLSDEWLGARCSFQVISGDGHLSDDRLPVIHAN